MNNIFTLAMVALVAGFGVYRSCTKYSHMLGAALAIDAIGVAVLIFIYWAVGILA